MATGGQDLERIAERLRGARAGGISRRDLLIRGGAFLGAVTLGGTLAACGGDDEESAEPARSRPRRWGGGRPAAGERRGRLGEAGSPGPATTTRRSSSRSPTRPASPSRARSTPAATTCSRSRRPRLLAPTTSSRRMPSTSCSSKRRTCSSRWTRRSSRSSTTSRTSSSPKASSCPASCSTATCTA